MNINFTKEEIEDIEKSAKSLSLTKEEYLINLHHKNSFIKEALKDSENLKVFIEGYYGLLDNLHQYRVTLNEPIKLNDDIEMVDTVIEFLNLTIKDPILLVQIYNLYKEKNEEDPLIV